MNFRDLIALVISNLTRMRGRVVMTAMGVVIGTAAIVILISLASGLQASTVNNFESYGTLNQITVFSSNRFGGGDSSDEGLTDKAIRELESIDGVVAVTPEEQFSGQSKLKYNRLVGFGSIYGIDPNVVDYMGFALAEGTTQLNHGSILIGAGIPDSFEEDTGSNQSSRGGGGPGGFGGFGGNSSSTDESTGPVLNLYGQTILLEMTRTSDDQVQTRTERLRVSGILESTGGNEDYNIYMSLRDLEDLTTWSQGERPNWSQDGYSQAIVIAEQDAETTLQVTDTITNDLGYFAFSTTSIVESLQSTFLIIEAVLGGVASIALLVAAIGIANTMVMSVLERTREIGLMKALGAQNRDVLGVFLAEASAIGLIGGIVGVLIGLGMAQVVNLFAGSFLSSSGSDTTSIVQTPIWLPIFAILFSMVIGLLAGIYPAFRAVQLDPVRALKYE